MQHLNGTITRTRLGYFFMSVDRFGQLIANSIKRMQARHWILEDHRHLIAAQLAQPLFWHRHEVFTVKKHFATDIGISFVNKAHHGLRRNTFA